MSPTTQTAKPLVANYDSLIKDIESSSAPEWFKQRRIQSLQRFEQIGVPTVKDEDYKYTNLANLTKQTFSVSTDFNFSKTPEYSAYAENDDAVRIVTINGNFSKELSDLTSIPAGIKILSLADALNSHESSIKQILDKYNPTEEKSLTALSEALSNNGTYIHITKNTIDKKLIHLLHITDSKNQPVISTPRTFIYAEASTEATILESYISYNDSAEYLSNGLTDIYLDNNAVLHYCKAQQENFKSTHIGNMRVWQERDTNLDSISVMAGGALTRNNLDIVVNGEGSNATLNGLYSVYANQHVDNHSSVDHTVPNCTSNQLYKGILNGSSRGVFNGKIFVREIAQQTNSYQLNKNLLLGKDARIDTKPQLEIHADDVKCTHGATVGQLNEDELFYLQTRCIPKTQAVKMLARGFVDDLLNTISNKTINDKLHVLLEPSFKQL